MERLTCPLIDYGCRGDRCAWWDQEELCCAVLSSLQLLKALQSSGQSHLTPLAPQPPKNKKVPKKLADS